MEVEGSTSQIDETAQKTDDLSKYKLAQLANSWVNLVVFFGTKNNGPTSSRSHEEG